VKKLAIIVGHEKKKDGASAMAPLSTTEYPFNKQVAEFMYVYARELQLDCQIFFRDGVGVSGAADAVHRWGADVCIELHFNSASPSAYGTETLHDAEPSTNAEFAAIVQKHMCEVLKRSGKGNRGVKFLKSGDRGHYNLLAVKCTSCLVEPFFGSNKEDCKLMWANVTGYSRSLVNAVVEFLNKGELN
jgi:N-acetylmuramoyl-L-alanine amidase